jgi:thiaminase/transcriptional activator TenA
MEQDSLYLVEFSKTLALIAGRSQCIKTIEAFLNFALGALIAERELHSKFIKQEIRSTPKITKSHACFCYTQFLLSTAKEKPIKEAIAAVIPCFWIYREVGRSILLNAKPNNPYMMWIQTYACQEFSEATNNAISILDNIAVNSTPAQLSAMAKAFETSTIQEYQFWDDAYKHKSR